MSRTKKSTHDKDIRELKEQVKQIVAAMTLLNNKTRERSQHRDRSVSTSTRRDSSITNKRKSNETHSDSSFQDNKIQETNFLKVARGTKAIKLQESDGPYQTPVSNSFEPLIANDKNNENDDNGAMDQEEFHDMIEESTTTYVQPTRKTKPPPPIVIHDLSDSEAKATINHVMVITDNRASLRYLGKNMSIITDNKADWTAVKEAVAAATPKLQYHTYTHNEDRMRAFVMRGAPAFVDHLEIQTELLTDHEIAAKVTPMKISPRNLNGIYEVVNMPLFQVLIGPEIPIERLFSIRTMSHFRVTWEKKRSRGQPTQCHHCQRFGHGGTNCGMTFRCVKCQENHGPKGCRNTKEANLPAVCVNCGKNHPANFRECSARLNYLARRSNTAPKPNTPRVITQPSRVVDKLAYAQVVAPSNAKTAAPGGPANGIEMLMKETQRLFGLDFFSFKQKCDNFWLDYSRIQDEQQKPFELVSFISSLSTSK